MHSVSIDAIPGEVWMVDFGLVAKQRPVLVLAFPQPQDARALVVVVPLSLPKPARSCSWRPFAREALPHEGRFLLLDR